MLGGAGVWGRTWAAEDLGLFEKVEVEPGAGVEDFDADEPAVFPAERDEPRDRGRSAGLDGGAARRERLAVR